MGPSEDDLQATEDAMETADTAIREERGWEPYTPPMDRPEYKLLPDTYTERIMMDPYEPEVSGQDPSRP